MILLERPGGVPPPSPYIDPPLLGVQVFTVTLSSFALHPSLLKLREESKTFSIYNVYKQKFNIEKGIS